MYLPIFIKLESMVFRGFYFGEEGSIGSVNLWWVEDKGLLFTILR
ncbi:hypothetical protein [Candidatus Hodgkinia cicadicola]